MSGQSENPYVGPRTFERDEADKYFGREREARDMLALAMTEQLVLFYAQSGAGKSSLINTRLIPNLEAEGFEVLPVARVGGTPQIEVDNIFTFNLMATMDARSQADPKRYARLTLKAFLAGLASEDGRDYYFDDSPEEEIEADAAAFVSWPRTLIIDQFEEILTENLAHWKKRADFFVQLREAMADDPDLWVILVMREDFVAGLEPYAYLMPGRLRARYYMQRMSYADALKAVQYPVKAIRPFADGVAEKLVENLGQVRIAATEENSKALYSSSQYIEPVQLQVACFQLWETLPSMSGEAGEEASITEEDLRRLSGGGSLNEFIDHALGQFYNDAVAAVTKDGRMGQTPYEVRDWFEKKLITESRTRALVLKGTEKTEGMANSVVEELERRFLLRYQTRAGSGWYELVHDRFVEPILEANAAWRERQPLVRAAQEWARFGRPPEKLYQGEQLAAAQNDPNAEVAVVQEFLQAGSDRENDLLDKKRQQRQKGLVAGAVILGLAVVITITVLGLFLNREQRTNARLGTSLTEEAVAIADAASSLATATAALATAESAQIETEKALARANAASTLEAQARATAEANLQALLLGSLVNDALSYSANEPERALLVAWEANDVATSAAAQSALLTALEASGSFKGEAPAAYPISTTLQSAGQSRLNRTAVNAEGTLIAVADLAGEITLWDVRDPIAVSQSLTGHTGAIFGLAFSPDGRWLASSSGDDFLFSSGGPAEHTVVLWDLDQTPPAPTTIVSAAVSFWDVAFSPDSEKLAAAQADGVVTVWDLSQTIPPAPGETFTTNEGDWLYTLDFSPEGTHLAAGSRSGVVFRWEVAAGGEPVTLRSHSDWVNKVVYSPDGQWLASLGDDGLLALWRRPEGQQPILESSYWLGTPVITAAFSDNGRLLVTGDEQGRITLLAIREPDENFIDYQLINLGVLKSSERSIRTVAFWEQRLLWTTFEAVYYSQRPVIDSDAASFAVDQALQIIAVVNDERFVSTDLETGQITSTAADGAQAANFISGTALDLYLRRPVDGTATSTPTPLPDITRAATSGDPTEQPDSAQGESIRCSARIERLQLVDALQTPRPISDCLTFDLLAVSPDGRRLASTDSSAGEAVIAIWSVNEDGSLARGPSVTWPHGITAVAFSAAGDRLVTADEGNTVTVWQIGEQALESEAQIEAGQSVTIVALDAGGRRLATGGGSGAVRLWDVGSERSLGTLAVDGWLGVGLLAFNEDGAFLTAVSAPFQTIYQWPMALGSWLEKACESAGRNLTNEEWEETFAGTGLEKSYELVEEEGLYTVKVNYDPTCEAWPWHPSLVESMVAMAQNEVDGLGEINTAAAEALYAKAAELAPETMALDDAQTMVQRALLLAVQEALVSGDQMDTAESLLNEVREYAPELALDVPAVLRAADLLNQINAQIRSGKDYEDDGLRQDLRQAAALVPTLPSELDLESTLTASYYTLCQSILPLEEKEQSEPCQMAAQLSTEIVLQQSTVETIGRFRADYWRFAGRRGQIIEVSSAAVIGDGGLSLTVWQPNWDHLALFDSYVEDGIVVNRYILPVDGDYYLRGYASWSDWRAYRLSVEALELLPVTLDQSVAGSFEERQIYSFYGLRSQAVDIRLDALDGSNDFVIELFGVDGQSLNSSYYEAPPGSVQLRYLILPEDGLYFMRPTSYRDLKEYMLTLSDSELLPLPADQAVTVDNERWTAWRFEAAADDFIEISVAITGTNPYGPGLTLFDPAGQAVAFGNYSGDGFNIVILPERLLQDGPYTVVLSAGQPPERVTLLRTILPTATVGLEQPITADFSDSLIWFIEAQSDTFVSVQLVQASDQNAFLSVIDPEGNTPASSGGIEPFLPIVDIRRPGRFAIVVSGPERGAYTLLVTPVSQSEIEIAAAEPTLVEGVKNRPEVWWFEGEAGDVVQIYQETADGIQLPVTLARPDGGDSVIHSLRENHLYLLPTDGRYVIIPFYENSPETITLHVALAEVQLITPPEAGETISYDGELNRATVWLFEGQSGEAFEISLFPTDGIWYPFLSLFGADGSLQSDLNYLNNGVRIFVVLSQDGRYYIVPGLEYESGNSYELQFMKVPPKG